MKELAELLIAIQVNDENYPVRYGLVLQAIAKANYLGLQTGFRIDPRDPNWPVAVIELPQGQISWHLPAHPVLWDGHTTEQKYKRIKLFVESVKA